MAQGVNTTFHLFLATDVARCCFIQAKYHLSSLCMLGPTAFGLLCGASSCGGPKCCATCFCFAPVEPVELIQVGPFMVVSCFVLAVLVDSRSMLLARKQKKRSGNVRETFGKRPGDVRETFGNCSGNVWGFPSRFPGVPETLHPIILVPCASHEARSILLNVVCARCGRS